MFKRLFYLTACSLLFVALTFFNYTSPFNGLNKEVIFYKDGGGSLAKEVTGKFNFLGSLGESTTLSIEETKALFESLSAKVMFIEEVEGTKNYYCYTNSLKNGVVLKNEKVNLHFSLSNGKITVGTPLIFGSF